jgi:hypothetical protein
MFDPEPAAFYGGALLSLACLWAAIRGRRLFRLTGLQARAVYLLLTFYFALLPMAVLFLEFVIRRR